MAKRKGNPPNEGENLNEGNNSDDNFGLPDLEYKPLDVTEESASTTISASFTTEENVSQEGEKESSEKSYSYTPPEEPKSNAPVIIAIIIGLVLVVSAFLIYQYVYKPKAEKAKKEQLAKQEADKKRKEEAARLAKEKEEAERRRLEEEKAAANAKPAEGTIEILTARTGRYHVVIASAVDDDLLMDYAKKLSAEGTSSMIVPPFRKVKVYRLVIGNYDTWADAVTNSEAVKSTYNGRVWVIKY